MPKRTQKKVSDGLSTPGRTGTERVLIKGQEKKSKLKDINRGQQRWRGGHVEGTERLDRRWIDERKVSFGVQYSISRKQSFFFSEGKSKLARDDVLACSIATTRAGRRPTGDLSTTTEEASERLYRARDAPPFWRTADAGTAPGQVFLRRRHRRRQIRCQCGRRWV